MRPLFLEYGGTILAIIIGAITIVICTSVLVKHSLVVDENTEVYVAVSAGNEPVIVSPKTIKIDLNDSTFDAYSLKEKRESEEYEKVYQAYLNLVEAYENSEQESACEKLSVSGIEQVDVTKVGRYYLFYKAENSSGHIYTKRVCVIVR